ncbi:MFS transporter [Piscinibacter sp. XHJ-5]|uniref:MFS transporter n=1 Tax=Piscinibacter sp. XHJ-5 TaxID=3037797 RepID=UPI00245344BB|nr:MFS transporter [Piscinibacter sp. XHJ-5]
MTSAIISAASARTLANAAWGVRAQFFIAGALFATWGVHVPSVKAHYALGERALAIAMLAAGVGALLALTQAGRVVGRFGPRSVTLATGLVCSAGIALLLAFDSYAALLCVMLVYGMASSLMDVSINAEASEIERLEGRPLMSGFHALFSMGGMIGAAAGGVLHAAHVAPSQHLMGAAAVGIATVVLGCSVMLRMAGPPEGGMPMSLPTGPLALIGLLAALGLIAEGAMYDWSVLYLKQELRADTGVAALAYASFSAAMAAARFAGDWVRARLAAVPLLRWSGALGAAGMALALLVPHPSAALVGFALVGLGFANVVPVLFSAAARVPDVTPAHGIAAVSAVGYLGMMAGPPLIGVIAEASSLTLGLSSVVVFAVVLALAARRALP